ncbi:MAG: SDR family NAD(P)-dependent oxidoreductase, partial [Bacteroidota bacterium]
MSKTILITGSSTGIGRASAIKFQKEGWNVVATMRSPQKETELNQLDNVIVERLDVQEL